MFKINITEIGTLYVNKIELELIGSWKDYTKVYASAISLCKVQFFSSLPRKKVDSIIDRIKRDDYDYIYELRPSRYGGFEFYKNINQENVYVPTLQYIGIPKLIPPLDIYLALEEYFGAKKTESERTDPIGITDDDKVIMHGFDAKNSFRG